MFDILILTEDPGAQRRSLTAPAVPIIAPGAQTCRARPGRVRPSHGPKRRLPTCTDVSQNPAVQSLLGRKDQE